MTASDLIADADETTADPDDYAPLVQTARKEKRRFAKSKISAREVKEILLARQAGHTAKEIAECCTTPITTSGVQYIIDEWSETFKELANVTDYRTAKSELLSAVELLLLKAMCDPEKIAKASLQNAAFAYDKINTINRLEQGKSTQNIAKVVFTEIDVDSIRAKDK